MGVRERLAQLFRRDRRGRTSPERHRDGEGREFAVIGLGTFGRSLALRLTELGFTVLGIDSDAAVVQAVAEGLSASLVLDATDEDALRQADIESYATAVVAIGGNHFEASALTTIALAKIGIPHILALAGSRRQQEILEAIGATRVLNPDVDGALALADDLTDPGRGETWSVTPSHQATLLPVPAELVSQSVEACTRLGVTVLLVARGEEITPLPPATFELRANDVLLILGSPSEVLTFRRIA